nr:hypothetical protein CTI12_AA129630 [Ipomoea trifida]
MINLQELDILTLKPTPNGTIILIFHRMILYKHLLHIQFKPNSSTENHHLISLAMALRFSALVFIACFAVFLGAVSAQYGGDGGDNNMSSNMPGMPGMGPAPPPSWASVNASPAAAIGFLSLVVSFFVVKRA